MTGPERAAPVPPITTFTRDALTFPVADTGPADGPPVVLLHGFPQDSRSWAPVAGLLNRAGHRTLVPDQRGYTPTASPPGRWRYRISELAADAVTLIEQAGLGPVHLVGHDWGAGVAWAVAATRPDLLASLTAVSVPHPAAFAASMLTGRQLLKSWYMFAVQLPWLPERLLRSRSGWFESALIRTGQAPAAAARDVELLRCGDTATTALNWYRALPFSPGLARALWRPITVPTLQIWSDGDVAVGRAGHDRTRRFVAGPWRLETLAGVSHWIPEQAPDQLAALITAHIGAVAGGE